MQALCHRQTGSSRQMLMLGAWSLKFWVVPIVGIMVAVHHPINEIFRARAQQCLKKNLKRQFSRYLDYKGAILENFEK